MLKLEQMEVLVGATIGMLDENLSEVDDPEVKEEIMKYKKQMEALYEQIMFAKFLEEIGVPEMANQGES